MKNKSKLGYTAGVFDMFHIGHLNILEKSKSWCEELIVGVSTDELVHQTKSHYPIVPFSERIAIIRSLKCVDKAYEQSHSDKRLAHQRFAFDEIFVGDDWKGSKIWNEYEIYFAKEGVKVTYFPYTINTSSTALRKLIKRKLI